jgi:hypothetical protein
MQASSDAALAALGAGRAAFQLGRVARAVELFERALAAADADAALPRDSLLVAALLGELIVARVHNAPRGAKTTDVTSSLLRDDASAAAAWRADPRACALSQRALALLLARSDASTLFAPLTTVERSVCSAAALRRHDEDPGSLPSQRADLLFCVAEDAVRYWPPLRDAAQEEARLRGVAAAARAALKLYAHGVLLRDGRRSRGLLLSLEMSSTVLTLTRSVLSEDAASGGLLHKLRALNALTRKEEATLRRDVLPTLVQVADAGQAAIVAEYRTLGRRAAADVARHGLRACALPGCGAMEPHPKMFKVCSRCRRACYCSAAHQQQDWRRHKREDACVAAPQ